MGIERILMANLDLTEKIFPEKPKDGVELLTGLSKSPKLVQKIVDEVLKNLNTISDKEIFEAAISIKCKKPDEIGQSFTEAVGGILEDITKISDSNAIKRLSSRPIQNQITRLANHPKIQKLLTAMTEEAAVHSENLNQELQEIPNPETRQFVVATLKKLKIIPNTDVKVTLKEKLAKAWEAIKNFFKKLFSCCKKKNKGEGSYNKQVQHQILNAKLDELNQKINRADSFHRSVSGTISSGINLISSLL